MTNLLSFFFTYTKNKDDYKATRQSLMQVAGRSFMIEYLKIFYGEIPHPDQV